MAVKCACVQEAEGRRREELGDGGRKRGSLPCPWADNGPPEEITAGRDVAHGQAFPALPGLSPRKAQGRASEEEGGQELLQEVSASAGWFLHPKASLHRVSVPSGAWAGAGKA